MTPCLHSLRRLVPLGLSLFLTVFSHRGIAQPAAPPREDDAGLTVFLDCPACDVQYIHTMVPWVAYVRDPADAQVHVLVTTLAASGGTEYTATVLGRGTFLGVNDTLRWVAGPGTTSHQVRHGLAHMLQLGLVRYAAGSAVAEDLSVDYHPTRTGTLARTGRRAADPWNHWLFTTGANGSLSGQQSQASTTFSSFLTANRTTIASKIDLTLSGTYQGSRFDLPDSSVFRTAQRNYAASAQFLQSAGAHWSVGERVHMYTNTHQNERLGLRVAPAVEYDVFPYADATRRQFAVQASAGVIHLSFVDTTLDNRLALTTSDLSMGAFLGAKQPWGSANVLVTSNAFLSDLRNQNLIMAPSVNLRLVKGLSLSVNGELDLLRNQPYLRRAGRGSDGRGDPRPTATAQDELYLLPESGVHLRLRVDLQWRRQSALLWSEHAMMVVHVP